MKSNNAMKQNVYSQCQNISIPTTFQSIKKSTIPRGELSRDVIYQEGLN